jgi:hypothetical protein
LQLSTQVSADLRRELTPAISQTLRAAVKEQLKGTLVDCFRTTFEATLVPAYEAGSREMFAQLQQTLAAGVGVMAAENKSMCERNHTETTALRDEIASLRSTVSSLEEKISELSARGGVSSTAAPDTQEAVFETDFKQLFVEGRRGESLEAALECKDVDSVLWVLQQQQQQAEEEGSEEGAEEGGGGLLSLLEASSPLNILCAAQQLSADLATSVPAEGIKSRLECLKELVMFLIDDHLPGDHDDVSPVVASTLEHLRSAEARHTLVGAARTDMKMLCSILMSNF